MDGNGEKDKRWNNLMDKVKEDQDESISTEHQPNYNTATEKIFAVSQIMQNNLVEDIYQSSGQASNLFQQSNQEFVTSGKNPVKITEDEIRRAVGGFTNMYLAHEISVNREFRLTRVVPETDSLEYQITIQLKKAFWDIFDENLKKSPPNYIQALSILAEMRTSLLSLLLPHNTSLRIRIMEVLDDVLIEQQVKNNVLDFQSYVEFIIDTLQKLCCPSRDPDLANLKTLTQPSEIFKGILELIDLMRLDMANYFIQLFRPNIIQHSIEYERAKFAEFIEIEHKLDSDGLRSTRQWLLRNRQESGEIDVSIAKAFTETLEWDQNNSWPETLAMDVDRYASVADAVKQISYIGALLLQTGVIYQQYLGSQNAKVKDLLKKHAFLIFPVEDVKDEAKTQENLMKIAEETIKIVNNEMKEMNLDKQLGEIEVQGIKDITNSIQGSSNKVKTLFVRRMIDFLETLTLATNLSQVPIPAGLITFQHEVVKVGIEFHRLAAHNLGVFKTLYIEVLKDRCLAPTFSTEKDPRDDPCFISILKALQLPTAPTTSTNTKNDNSVKEEDKENKKEQKSDPEKSSSIKSKDEVTDKKFNN